MRRTFTVELAALGLFGEPSDITDGKRPPALATFHAAQTAAEGLKIQRLVVQVLGAEAYNSLQRVVTTATNTVANVQERLLAADKTMSREAAWRQAWASTITGELEAAVGFADAQLRAAAFLAQWNTLWVSGPGEARDLAAREVSDEALFTLRAAFDDAMAKAKAGNEKPSAG